MSCDISDPAITETYQEIVSGAATNWMVMGYHESRDKISFYNSGTKGVEEMKTHLGDEVLYVFIRILGDRNILITYVSEQVSGVRRARALVHGRAIAALLKEFHAQFSASKLEELTESALASRLKSKELEGMADRVPLPQQQPQHNKEDGGGIKHGDGKSVRPGTPRSPSEESLHSMPSPLPSDTADARANQARNELERKARVEAERLAREESELAAKEMAILEETRRQERELQAKREMERTNRENLKREFALAEKSGKATFLSGYISHQLSDSGLWKRRWFVMKGKTLYLYKDEKDELPIDSISLGGAVVSIQDAHGEVLIPHSFKVEHKSKGNYYFYADDEPLKELAIAGLLKMAEEK